MTKKQTLPIHHHTKADDRVAAYADRLRTPQERNAEAERLRYARAQVLAEDFKAAVDRQDYREALKLISDVLRYDERARLWRKLGAERAAAFAHACPAVIHVIEPALRPGELESLRVRLTPESELPDVVWVSGPSRLTTRRFVVDEDEAEILEDAGLTVTARAVPHAPRAPGRQAPAVKFSGLAGTHQMPGVPLVGDMVERDAPAYELTCEGFPFGFGARIKRTRTVQVSLGLHYGYEEREVTEDAGESPTSIPRLVDRDVVEILLRRDPEFRARATVKPATVEERRRLAKQRAQDEAMRSVGALGGSR